MCSWWKVIYLYKYIYDPECLCRSSWFQYIGAIFILHVWVAWNVSTNLFLMCFVYMYEIVLVHNACMHASNSNRRLYHEVHVIHPSIENIQHDEFNLPFVNDIIRLIVIASTSNLQVFPRNSVYMCPLLSNLVLPMVLEFSYKSMYSCIRCTLLLKQINY